MAQGKLQNIFSNQSNYIKFPFGWALCWGQADNTANGYARVTFPVNFQGYPFFIACPYYYTNHDGLDYNAITSFSGNDGIVYFVNTFNTAGLYMSTNASSIWIAIGKYK